MNSKRTKALFGIFSLMDAVWSIIAFFVLHLLIGWLLDEYLFMASQGLLYIFTGIIFYGIQLAIIGGVYYVIRVLERLVLHAPLENSPKSIAFVASYIVPIIAYVWLFLGTEEPLFSAGVVGLTVGVRLLFDYIYVKRQKKQAML